MAEKFDVIIIGGGPGGYVAAIRAAQLKLNTAIVEMDRLGGVCLNWGCIPTKALLQSAHLLQEMQRASEFGITADNIKPNFDSIISRSRKVAEQMSKGVDYLMKKNKVQVIQGRARFINETSIQVENGSEVKIIEAHRFIVATGARSKPFAGVPFDNNQILSSKEAMLQKEIPNRLAIIGAGAIGVEFADFYSSMGTKVTIIEYLEHLLPNEDEEVSNVLERSFKKKGIQQLLYTSVNGIQVKANSVELKIQSRKEGSAESILEVDKVLVGIGLIPNTENLNLEQVGVKLKKGGFIEVDQKYKTTNNFIYAIGDCNGPPLLAHVASMEGIKAAEAISIELKKNKELDYQPINYNYIPGCTYCHPEVASLGKTERKAKQEGIEVKVGKFPFTASGRAQAMGDTTGFVKVITDAKYGEILGAHIIGPNASEMLSEILLAAAQELTAHNIAITMHAHPTLSEAIMEACADSLGEAINI